MGDEIFVPGRIHVSRGREDFAGGVGRVADVIVEDLGGHPVVFVEIEEDPGGRYNWTTWLGPLQAELRAAYGERRARAAPDERPEHNVPIEHEVPRQRPLVFATTGHADVPYETWLRGEHWTVRINDFPAEPLYTLLIDGAEIDSFSEWPSVWQRPALARLPREPVPVSKETFREGPRSRSVRFRRTWNPERPFAAEVDGRRWVLRINDFPVRAYFTLLIDGEEIEDFNYDEVPACWKIPWLL